MDKVTNKVADMVADMVADKRKEKLADIELDMVADMEVDKVTDMVADKRKKEEKNGGRVGHKGWLIGPKLFQPEAYPDCASSKAFRVYFGRSLAITFT